ncbi:50S ribosomal protein L11 methyltransferase [Candidatus Thioglobus sp.]|nr:50S ribosomal protein L11 methyltransferase [Candidatus Thioglobus sp.]
MHWNQISFEVNKLEADLASEVLIGLGSISITYSDAQDNAIFEPPVGETPLWEFIRITALFQSEVNSKLIIDSLIEICNIKVNDIIKLKNKIWEDECQKDFPSMQFGKKLWVCPSWDSKLVIPSDAITIKIDPGLAFGTGTHQTTRLCLEYLDENPPKALTVIDFGCGTSILAIAAAKLGAKRVIAIDNDPQAVIASRENVAKNNSESFIKILNSIEKMELKYCDLLMANILTNPLIELESQFSELVKPNGSILLSGILEEQVEKVIDCYSKNFNNIKIKNKEEWFRISAMRNN